MKEKVSRLYSPRFIEMFFILFPIIEVLTSILKRNFKHFVFSSPYNKILEYT